MTIKPIVRWLKVRTQTEHKLTMNEAIHTTVSGLLYIIFYLVSVQSIGDGWWGGGRCGNVGEGDGGGMWSVGEGGMVVMWGRGVVVGCGGFSYVYHAVSW